MRKCVIDIVDVKKAIDDGLLEVEVRAGRVFLVDLKSEERVSIGNSNKMLNEIADDMNKLRKVASDKVYVGINNVFDVLDAYRVHFD